MTFDEKIASGTFKALLRNRPLRTEVVQPIRDAIADGSVHGMSFRFPEQGDAR